MTSDPTESKRRAANTPAAEDLSEEISKSLDRQPDERIKVVRVFEDYYRCNWWVRDSAPHPFWLATGTIRKSRFVHAAKTKNGDLRVEGAA